MTNLLPQSDKVEVYLGGGERVTVPDGKIWEVTVVALEGTASLDSELGQVVIADDNNNDVESYIEMTLHEGMEIRGFDTVITGWGFNYK